MSHRPMKCLSCGRRIIKPTLDKGKGYCNDCVKKTNALLRTLDKLIPYITIATKGENINDKKQSRILPTG